MSRLSTLCQTILLAAGIAVGVSYASESSSPKWTLIRDNAGQNVQLVVDKPLPVRSAEPVLIVDGKEIPATVSPDRRVLTARLDSGSSGTIKRVEQAWRGEMQLRAARAARSSAPVRTRRDVEGAFPEPFRTFAASGAAVPDSLRPGPYQVTRADYDLGDEAVQIMGGRTRVERAAAVYVPSAPGKLPLVVFQHGMHSWCSVAPSPGAKPWPCPPGSRKIKSYLGYDMAAQALASQGYLVVSISANGINAYDNTREFIENYGSGYEARAWLILDHLDFLSQANMGKVPQLALLAGRIDLDRVGLMGHSRGGEAVARAVHMNASRKSTYGIRAVLPLAPTAAEGRTAIPDVPMATILPYCDGDVNSLEGQDYQDDSRYAFPDNVLRSSILLMGGNHNFFNEVWSNPSDGGSDDSVALGPYAGDPICGVGKPGRLDALTQRRWGSAYIAAFFRMTLGGETSFLPLFDGSGARLPGMERVDAHTDAMLPASARNDIARFTDESPVGSNSGVAMSLCGGNFGRCALAVNYYRAPNLSAFDNTMARVKWTASNASLTIPLASNADASVFRWLSFRAMPALMQVQPQDLQVTLIDSAGRRSNPIRVADYSDALAPVLQSLRPTFWLQTVKLPLADFSGIDLKNLHSVVFQAANADLYLSDLALIGSSVGTGKVTSLPSIKALGVSGQLGNVLYLTLSSPSSLPAQIELSKEFSPNLVTIPAGRSCAAVPVSWQPGQNYPWIQIRHTRNAYPAIGIGTIGSDQGLGAQLAQYCN